jgi:deoxyribose-phosphate aldolase
MFSRVALAKLIDHSLLRPDATEDDVIRACEQAREYHFACMMVLPYWCQLAERRLRGSDVKVGTVVGYPLGATPTAVKVYEAKNALGHGAMELDFVVNLGILKAPDAGLVQRDIEDVVTVAKLSGLTHDGEDVIVKVIVEVGLTSREEQTRVCKIAKGVRADFIKTCTGLGPRGVTVQDVKFLRQTLGRDLGVKAAGGIRTLEQASALINAGANRLGTSTGVSIVDAYERAERVEATAVVEEEARP